MTYTAPANRPELSELAAILECLAAFAKQRPGLEFGNYGDVAAYRSEMRGITRDLHHARALIAAIAWRDSITAEKLKDAFRAYGGRLTWDGEKRRLDYCVGQYFPTEYRRAVCAVLASALWDYMRENLPTDDKRRTLHHNSETGETLYRYDGLRAGDYIRRAARREFGAAIAKRWFN